MKGKNRILKTGHADGRFIGHSVIWLCLGQVTDINIIMSLGLWWAVCITRDMGKQTCKMRCIIFTTCAKRMISWSNWLILYWAVDRHSLPPSDSHFLIFTPLYNFFPLNVGGADNFFQTIEYSKGEGMSRLLLQYTIEKIVLLTDSL